MIIIVASYNVIPNQPTPKDPLWLSDNDHLRFVGHVPTIYIYKAKHSSNIIERMRNSLSKILVYYYPLAGRLSLTKSGRMEVDCNVKGVTLLEAETTKTLGDYGDFSPTESTKELAPKVDYTHQPMEEIPLLLVQVTRFHGGEGLAIGVAFSHTLVDGVSAIRFINTWSKLARGEELDLDDDMPFLDRKLLKFPHQPPSAPRVDDLPAYSRFEAVAAHIWRCASKARESSGENLNQPTLVQFPVDIRSRLNPPLPQNYFGNALAKIETPKCHVGEITSNPLSYAAQKIRDAVNVVTDEYMRSHFILDQRQLDCIRGVFMGKGIQMTAPHPGKHNIMITSWMSMPVYEADFGWGKPMYFGLANEFCEQRALIIPSSDGDGVVVSLISQTAHMQLLNKYFYEDT